MSRFQIRQSLAKRVRDPPTTGAKIIKINTGDGKILSRQFEQGAHFQVCIVRAFQTFVISMNKYD